MTSFGSTVDLLRRLGWLGRSGRVGAAQAAIGLAVINHESPVPLHPNIDLLLPGLLQREVPAREADRGRRYRRRTDWRPSPSPA